MRFLPLVLLAVLVPLAIVRPFRSSEPGEAQAERSATPAATEPIQVVPRGAVLVVETAEWDAVRERARESDWVAFFTDERLRRLYRSLPIGASGMGAPPELTELLSSVHGRVVLFVVPLAGGGVGVGIVAEPASSDGALEAGLRDLAHSLEGQAEVSTESHEGVELVLLEPAAGMPGPGVVFAFATPALVGGVFAPGEAAARELVHGVLDRQRGVARGEGFEASETYTTRPQLGRQPALALHVAVQALADSQQPGWRRTPAAARLAPTGLDSIEWLHVYADLGPGEELDCGLEMHLPDGGLIAALARCFGPLPTEMAALLPDESLGVGLVSFDVGGAWGALQEFMRRQDPQAYEAMRLGLMRAEADLGVDLEHDFFDQMTGAMASFSMRLEEEDLPPILAGVPHAAALAQGGAFFVELRDPKPVRRLVARGLAYAGIAEEVRQSSIAGLPAYSLDFEDAFRLHWAFTDGGLVVSEYEEALRTALGAKPPGDELPVVGARLRQALAEHEDASAVSLVDTRSSVETLLSLGPLVSVLAGDLGPMMGLDRLPWPPASMAAGHFDGTLAFTVSRTEDRLAFRFAGR